NRFPEASHATLPRQREMCRYAALMDRYIRSHAAEEGMDTMLHAGLNRKAGNFDRAEAIARMALKRSPGWHNATALGLVLRKKGDLVEAEKAFEQALRFDPDDMSARLEAGDTFFDWQKWDSALRWYENALAKDPGQPWAKPSALFCRWKLT